MNEKELIEKFLKRRGWSTWYDNAYWVHEKIVDSNNMDYTNYGMDLQSAFIFEVENLPKFKPMGLPIISKSRHETDRDVIEYYFGKTK